MVVSSLFRCNGATYPDASRISLTKLIVVSTKSLLLLLVLLVFHLAYPFSHTIESTISSLLFVAASVDLAVDAAAPEVTVGAVDDATAAVAVVVDGVDVGGGVFKL
jgi:protein-S-isoprenylcysteine O-methyltransferase Ste14